MRREGRRWGRLVGALLALAVIGVVISVIARGRSLPDEPQPVAWNHQACAHCRMAVGEPTHAAQLITRDGEVLFFDDPGCLMSYLAERQPSVHRIWFHDRASERWIPAADVGFVPGATTPMGFGLAATDRTTPGAMSFDDARRWIDERRAGELSDARPTDDHALPAHADDAAPGAPAGELR